MFTIGDKFQHNFVLSSEIYQGFISLFDDKNPLHTDENFAKSKGFQGKVMHGNILGGFLSYFIGELLPTKNVIIHKQTIAFLNPVYEEDTLLLESQVADIYESVNVIVFKFTFLVKDKKVAKGQIEIGII